jgi:hypothetical protein
MSTGPVAAAAHAGYHCAVHNDPRRNADGRTGAHCLFFGCGPDHTLRAKRILPPQPPTPADLPGPTSPRPPEINLADHPDELLADLFENEGGDDSRREDEA